MTVDATHSGSGGTPDASDLDRVRAIVAGIAGLSDPSAINPRADLYRDVGVKSVRALDLLLSLEDAFGVQIPDEAFGDARTVEALADLVRRLR